MSVPREQIRKVRMVHKCQADSHPGTAGLLWAGLELAVYMDQREKGQKQKLD